MKRMISTALAGALIFSLCACGADRPDPAVTPSEAPPVAVSAAPSASQTEGGSGQTSGSNILIVYFTADENREVDAVTSASLTTVDGVEGISVAQALSAQGYQSFVVDYRLRPYTQQEGALDLARAVRFVRAHGSEYGIDEKDIAVMGFSAGGILAGEMLLHWDGTVSPETLDSGYIPDELDRVSADAAADGMIYSFYDRLSVGTTDVELLRSGNLPPTFYCYGTRDPFYRQFLANAGAAEQAGVRWSGSSWTVCPTALAQAAAGCPHMTNF